MGAMLRSSASSNFYGWPYHDVDTPQRQNRVHCLTNRGIGVPVEGGRLRYRGRGRLRFRVAWQLLSSAAFSIGHGGNDAQKVMGIIGAALIANGTIQNFSDLPTCVPVACYIAIGLGTMSGGWKIVKTMGTKITKVTPLEGVAAETSGAFTLFFTGQMGIPVSTTHTITGSIIGAGTTKRVSAVRWGVTINMLWAWILSIPVSGLLAAIAGAA